MNMLSQCCCQIKTIHVVYDERTAATKNLFLFYSINGKYCMHKNVTLAVNMFWIVKKEKEFIGVTLFLAASIFCQNAIFSMFGFEVLQKYSD